MNKDIFKVGQYLGTEWGIDGSSTSQMICGEIVPVLQFLWGHKLDEKVIAYVHSLRPSWVRISDGTIKLDARKWRVTIYINKHQVVRKIEQEVEVLLPVGVENGYELAILSKRI